MVSSFEEEEQNRCFLARSYNQQQTNDANYSGKRKSANSIGFRIRRQALGTPATRRWKHATPPGTLNASWSALSQG